MSLANRTIDLASKQVLVAADGTAAAPSITNDGDTNTGMFFPAADTIAFSEGGTEALRLTSTGAISVGSSGTNYGSSNQVLTSQGNTSPTWVNAYTGFKNRIINGDMRIDQRNAGASVTPTDQAYGVDRWKFYVSQASKYTCQQSSVAPDGFDNSILITSTSSYSVGTGERFMFGQSIEGYNASDLAFGTSSAKSITISFWVRSSLTGTFGGAIGNVDSSRTYPFSYSISSANTWEKKTITIDGDTSGTWNKTNDGGLWVYFGIGVGSSLSGTSGSWYGTNRFSSTGATSVVGTNGATFYLTGVQLEAGTAATDFERRPYGTELALCQRYYQTINPTDSSPTPSGRWGANIIAFMVPTPVPLRSSPTITTSGTFSYAGGGVSGTFTSPSLGSWSSHGVTLIKSGLTDNPSGTQAYIVWFGAGGVNPINLSSEI